MAGGWWEASTMVLSKKFLVVFGCCCLMLLLGCLFYKIFWPRVVVEGAHDGRTMRKEGQLNHERAQLFIDEAKRFILSKAPDELPDDTDLLRMWQEQSIVIELANNPDGSTSIFYDIPVYSTRYFSLSKWAICHGGSEVEWLNARVRQKNSKVHEFIRGQIESLWVNVYTE